MREFNFSKTYEEFKIGGKVYKMPFDDKAISTYRKALMGYSKQAEKLSGLNPKNFEEEEKLFKDSLNMAENLLNLLLGEGSFVELYEASGKSTEQISILIEFLGSFIVEKSEKFKEEKFKKYVG